MRMISINRRFVLPLYRFMNDSSTSGIVLFAAALLAMLVANSFMAAYFDQLWAMPIGLSIGQFEVNKPLLLWINDGLMSIFFFVVGLELKRELLAGELSTPRNAVLPIVAGLGGMVLPALIYASVNFGAPGEASRGWGIPMATDIAFTLGVLYLLGKHIPLSLKVFLTALAIIDDLGAVLVIALFYTSDISVISLCIGGLFLGAMMLGNWLGIRSALFYGLLGIGGLWLAFLLSGVHATIAAVLAAFTIPASVGLSRKSYTARMRRLIGCFNKEACNGAPLASHEEQQILGKIEHCTHTIVPPLQKLEHALHPLVAFGVIPLFALANAGVSLSGDLMGALSSSVALGIALGLLAGKVLGIVGFIYLFDKLGLIQRPAVLTYPRITGAAFLAAIGFTMSLFITGLAFDDATLIRQAKLGILLASLIAGLIGYAILRRTCSVVSSAKTGAA